MNSTWAWPRGVLFDGARKLSCSCFRKVCACVCFDGFPELQNEKNRVGVGRTELSLRLPGILLRAQSYGRGPKVGGYQAVCKSLDYLRPF